MADREPTSDTPVPPADGAGAPGGAAESAGFLAEWRRRHMGRAAAAYVFAAFAIMGGVEVTVTAFDLPHWALSGTVTLLALGFVGNLLFAWHFDVEEAQDGPRVRRAHHDHPAVRKPSWATVTVLGIVAAGVGVWTFWPAPRPPPPPRSVLVADLEDRAGLPGPGGTLEEVVELGLEDGPDLGALDRAEARLRADRLALGGRGLPVDRARSVAGRSGAVAVVGGAVERRGTGLRVELRAVEPASGKSLGTASADAPAAEGLPAAALRAAARLRSALGSPEARGPDFPEGAGAARAATRDRAARALDGGADPAPVAEELAALVKGAPADGAALALLARARLARRELHGALGAVRASLALDPESPSRRSLLARISLATGDLPAAEKEARAALDRDPAAPGAHATLALAQLLDGRRDEAAATWGVLAALGTAQASQAAEGLADLAAYEGRIADARELLARGLTQDQARKDDAGAARKGLALAELELAAGSPARAAALAARVHPAAGDIHTRCMKGIALGRAGDARSAEGVAAELEGSADPWSRGCAELVRGMVDAQRRAYPAAVARFARGAREVDAWLGHALTGRAYLDAAALAQADEELGLAVTRRGEGASAFLDGRPTARLVPDALYRLALAKEALGSDGKDASLRSFLAVKRGVEDPLVGDARRRLGNR